MKKNVIGISANEIEDSGTTLHNLPISYIPAGYAKGVQLVGGLPLLLPIGTPSDAKQYVDQIDKLILTGGQNVDPVFYREETMFDAVLKSTKRDKFEIALIEEMLSQKKPIFAVCRGMQLLNVSLGGSLFQDISVRVDQTIQHMQAPVPRQVPTHRIRTEPNSILRDVYGEHAQVNSFHYQAIKDVAPKLRVTAISEDHIIEGVESISKDHHWVGVQWHPDFSYDTLEQELRMFDFVVNDL